MDENPNKELKKQDRMKKNAVGKTTYAWVVDVKRSFRPRQFSSDLGECL
jgi:hypothetical protein